MNEEIKKLDFRKIEKAKFRQGITALEERMKAMPGALIGDNDYNPLKHSFADGCYIREIFSPADQFIISKIHKFAHPFFILAGEVSILTEDGIKKIKGPYYGITKAGTKRLIYTHSDVICVTIHVTQETDLKKIEPEIYAKDFEEFDQMLNQDTLKLKGETT